MLVVHWRFILKVYLLRQHNISSHFAYQWGNKMCLSMLDRTDQLNTPKKEKKRIFTWTHCYYNSFHDVSFESTQNCPITWRVYKVCACLCSCVCLCVCVCAKFIKSKAKKNQNQAKLQSNALCRQWTQQIHKPIKSTLQLESMLCVNCTGRFNLIRFIRKKKTTIIERKP